MNNEEIQITYQSGESDGIPFRPPVDSVLVEKYKPSINDHPMTLETNVK